MTDAEKLKARTNLLLNLKKDAEKILGNEDGEDQVVDFVVSLVEKIEALKIEE